MRIANMLIVACVLLAWIALATGGLIGWYLRGRHEREKRRELPPASARRIERAARANRLELPAVRKARSDIRPTPHPTTFDPDGETRP